MKRILSLLLSVSILLMCAAAGLYGCASGTETGDDTPGHGTESPGNSTAPELPPFLNPSPTADPALRYSPEELLEMMTLDEKIGQMTQAERQDINTGDIRTYFLGSVLSGGGSTPRDNSVIGWNSMVAAMMNESKNTRLGIPLIYGIDAVHGHNNVVGAVIFPHNIGLGAIAAGNLELGKNMAYEIGKATAQEMLMTSIRWTFAPVLGVPYDVRWGRTYEGFGENIGLVTDMGSAVVRGLQSSGFVTACMKHYIGEGQTEGGRNQGNAILSDGQVRELLPPYIEAIEAGALTLMPSFSSINGLKMHENKYLLTDVLKGELGFEGFIITDWAAVTQLTGKDYKEQIANAINAGNDMVMATNGRKSWTDYIKLLKELVEEGTVPMERIDDAVLRILRVKQKIRLFDEPYYSIPDSLGDNGRRLLAREAAAHSAVLLKNEGDIIGRLGQMESILVAGRGASDIGMQCGGWTITWQGSHGDITPGTTLLEGFGIYHSGITYASDGKTDSSAGSTAGSFDCAIVVIGESPYAETEGDRPGGVNLHRNDFAVLDEIYKLDIPVVVIMLSGRPMLVADELGRWDGFIAAWLPGTEGAGIADALFGSMDFTGRTPYAWPADAAGSGTIFPYGFGLSKGDNG